MDLPIFWALSIQKIKIIKDNTPSKTAIYNSRMKSRFSTATGKNCANNQDIGMETNVFAQTTVSSCQENVLLKFQKKERETFFHWDSSTETLMALKTTPGTLNTELEETHCSDSPIQTTRMAVLNPLSRFPLRDRSATSLESWKVRWETSTCTTICSSLGVNLSEMISPSLPQRPMNTLTSQFQDVIRLLINSVLENSNWTLRVQFIKSKEEFEPTSTQSLLGLMPVTFMAQTKKLQTASDSSGVENFESVKTTFYQKLKMENSFLETEESIKTFCWQFFIPFLSDNTTGFVKMWLRETRPWQMKKFTRLREIMSLVSFSMSLLINGFQVCLEEWLSTSSSETTNLTQRPILPFSLSSKLQDWEFSILLSEIMLLECIQIKQGKLRSLSTKTFLKTHNCLTEHRFLSTSVEPPEEWSKQKLWNLSMIWESPSSFHNHQNKIQICIQLISKEAETMESAPSRTSEKLFDFILPTSAKFLVISQKPTVCKVCIKIRTILTFGWL